MDQKFPKTIRLVTQLDFDRVHNGKIFAADDTLVIKAAVNELGHTRIGLSVGKKVGNAVIRNRWKRLIRESFRLQKSKLPTNLDIVVRPRKGGRPDFQKVYDSLRRLIAQIDRRIQRKKNQ